MTMPKPIYTHNKTNNRYIVLKRVIADGQMPQGMKVVFYKSDQEILIHHAIAPGEEYVIYTRADAKDLKECYAQPAWRFDEPGRFTLVDMA